MNYIFGRTVIKDEDFFIETDEVYINIERATKLYRSTRKFEFEEKDVWIICFVGRKYVITSNQLNKLFFKIA